MSANQDTLYIKADRNVEVTKTDITLGDILEFECSNKNLIPHLKTLKICKIPNKGKQRVVISVLKIIACIHQEYPNLEVQNMGEQDVIVTYENQQTPGLFLHVLKTAMVVLVTFLGAAFSIMAFNNDVDVPKLFSQIYKLVVGSKPNGFTVLELTYSIGLAIGILVFFNHIGRKRLSVDPTPMEVQMRVYENDIQTTLVENASRRKEELNVGQANHSGTHRT